MPYWLRTLDHSYGEIARVASTGSNISIAAPGATIDGVSMVIGDLVFLKDQTVGTENGMFVWFGAAVAMIRHASLPLPQGAIVYVTAGTLNAGTAWTLRQAGPITPGGTALAFTRGDDTTPWNTIAEYRGTIAAGTAAGTFLLSEGGAAHVLSTAAVSGAVGIFHLDPTTNYVQPGKTHSLRVVGTVENYTAAQTGNFTFGLYPITALSAAGVPTLGSVVGAPSAIASPASGSMNTVYGTGINMPAAGHYCVGLVTSAVIAATSVMIASAKLQMRPV